MSDFADSAAVSELMRHYGKWRSIYALAGKPSRDEPRWDDEGRLWLSYGYPHPDWTAFVIEPQLDGYKLFRASTERRNEPVLSPQGFFSRLDVAGKYVIAKVGNYLRIDCRMDPVTWAWEDAGLEDRVGEVVYSDREVKYFHSSDENNYFVMTLADRPYSHILPLTYDDLNSLLLMGFPEHVTCAAK